MSTSELILGAVIALLIATHYASLIYRLHKAEVEMARMRESFSVAAIGAANAAAQAVIAAGTALQSERMKRLENMQDYKTP